jgi:hypothetical protein
MMIRRLYPGPATPTFLWSATFFFTFFLGAFLVRGGIAHAKDTFTAPNGDLGANLSVDKTQISRLHGELSYFTATSNGTTGHALMLTTGFGVKVAGNFEIAAGLAGMGLLSSTASNQYAVGNVMLGGNYVLGLADAFRLKIGGAVAFGPWNMNGSTLTSEGVASLTVGRVTRVYQEPWYSDPTRVHFVIPVRVEFDPLDSLVLTADFQPDFGIGINGAASALFVTLAPGVAYWASDMFAFGARLPIQAAASLGTGGGGDAQVAFEPFVRFELGESGFLATRFTLNLDEPGGFSFNSGKYWGWHVAVGGNF